MLKMRDLGNSEFGDILVCSRLGFHVVNACCIIQCFLVVECVRGCDEIGTQPTNFSARVLIDNNRTTARMIGLMALAPTHPTRLAHSIQQPSGSDFKCSHVWTLTEWNRLRWTPPFASLHNREFTSYSILLTSLSLGENRL